MIDAKRLQRCPYHARVVFDEKVCPCCRMIKELGRRLSAKEFKIWMGERKKP